MNTWLPRFGRDTLYLFTGFFVALPAFVVVVTGISLAAGLLVVWVGVPVAVGTLLAARAFGALEWWRLGMLTGTRPAPRQPVPIGRGRFGWLRPLGDSQGWLDVLHAIVAFPVATTTWSLLVSWWAVALGGLTYWLWSRFLPVNTGGDDNLSLAELLGWGPDDDVALYSVLGVVFLLTLPAVTRVMAFVQSALARVFVANDQLSRLRERVQTLSDSREAVVAAGDTTLRRVERDLHDGPQQRLVRLQMDLASAERRLADDPAAARALVVEAQAQVEETLGEIRALARGIAPPILSDRGLAAALASVAARCPVDVALDVRLPDGQRLPAAQETAAYFVVSEALANVAKHAGASRARVGVRVEPGAPGGGPGSGQGRGGDGHGGGRSAHLRVEVYDDGVGGATTLPGHGLAGLSDRVAGVDGTLSVSSPQGGPTLLVAQMPLPAGADGSGRRSR